MLCNTLRPYGLFKCLQAVYIGQAEAQSEEVVSVEGAAVSALVAAVMKLSEAQFKPLFLRLLSWASTPPAGQPGDISVYCVLVSIPGSIRQAHASFPPRDK